MDLNEISLGAKSPHQPFCVSYPGLNLSVKDFSEYIIIIVHRLHLFFMEKSKCVLNVFNVVKSIMGNYFYSVNLMKLVQQNVLNKH